jgi:hypothetical protein
VVAVGVAVLTQVTPAVLQQHTVVVAVVAVLAVPAV